MLGSPPRLPHERSSRRRQRGSPGDHRAGRAGQRQRGSVSVEFALVMPLLLLVIVGGVHFGRILMTRHRLTEATNYATRAAAIAHNGNPNQIRTLIQNRLGSSSGCTSVQVTAATSTDALGVTRLDVQSRCLLAPAFGGGLLGSVGPSDLVVNVSMPF
jgi:Flp pilus assembly protein TadG